MDLSPAQRDAFVDKHCAEDPSLKQELKSLLASDEKQTGGALTGAIGAAAEATTRARRKELLGSVIGPYRLSGVLGHGGAGTVYLAERIDRQYSAQVAIKVVEGAALNAEISRRFRAERQILANLNHQNIARLIDAGETAEGYPYLVMEYVHGEPISDYCDRVKLSVEDRVQLILRVCGAVQYAHQNLVVHRDIKPANILVTPDGSPKLLDFGIAKLLDTDALAAEMALTRMNDRVLTPEYASPEQILGQAVTTASDVYALGIVLYELLTGLRPYKVSSASQLELERTICVIEPFKPSVAIKQSFARKAKTQPTVAPTTLHGASTRDINNIVESRRLTPHKLAAKLGGDLDAILMRALRKEPIYRYSSVEQFAADLRRHLAREPVLARQGNWFYYTRRYARRNALPVAAATAFVALLAGAAINYSIQNKRIAEERDIANREKKTSDAVADFMVNVFAASDPFEVQGREVTAQGLLDKSTRSIQGNLAQEPAVRARLLEAMGRTYSRQGKDDRGIDLIEEALALKIKTEGPDSTSLTPTLINLGKARLNKGDYIGAEQPLNEAKRQLESRGELNTLEYASVLQRLAALEGQRGNKEAALTYYRQAMPLLERLYGTMHSEYAIGLSSYANALFWNDNYPEAEKYAKKAVEIYKVTESETHPDRMNAESLLGRVFLQQGQVAQAAPLIENRYKVYKRVFGPNSTRLLSPLNNLISLKLQQNDLRGAEVSAREALRISGTQDKANFRTGQLYEALGITLLRQKRLSESETVLREALRIYGETLPPDHMYVASSEHFLGEVLLAQKQYSLAITQFKTAMLHLENANAEKWRIARSESALGEAMVMSGSYTEGESYLIRSYQTLITAKGASKELIEQAEQRLERLHTSRTIKSH